MNFLSPWAFLGLLAMLPILALYFLKLKRSRVQVSSTWLWQRSIQDLQVNAPFQKLRKSLLLIVQLLLVAIAAVALAQPSGSPVVSTGKGVVILIDRSASMSAKDVEPSRLENAKKQAKDLLGGLGAGDPVMVISFDRRANVVLPFSTDRRQAEGAIDSIAPSSTTTRIGEAFQMALSALRTPSFKQTEIVIFSDGQFEAITAPTEGIPVRFVAIGGKIKNAAITAMDVRRPALPDEPWTVFAQVDGFSAGPMEVPVELVVDGRLKSVKSVKLEPNSTQAVIFEVRETPEIVELRIAAEDDLAADNRAWMAVRAADVKVLLVTPGNFFLEKAIVRMPGVSVYPIRPDQLTADHYPDYDLVVFDAFTPTVLPEGRYLFLGALPGWEGIKSTGTLERPEVVDWDRRHRVTRFINFSGLAIGSAPKLQLPAAATPIAEAKDGPLIFTWQKQRTRAVVVGFKILDSDWPLRLSFPLMIANALEWLKSDDVAEWRGHPMPGDALPIRLGPKDTWVEVTAPDGRKEKLEGKPGGEVTCTQTEAPGVYAIKRSGGGLDRIALNLWDPVESSGRVQDQLKMGEESIKAADAVPPPRQEGWKLFAWIALAVLLAEWWIYHRRIDIF